MSNRNVGIIAVLISVAVVIGTIGGCVGRAEAVINHLTVDPGAPV